jgi:hypothetical protein
MLSHHKLLFHNSVGGSDFSPFERGHVYIANIEKRGGGVAISEGATFLSQKGESGTWVWHNLSEKARLKQKKGNSYKVIYSICMHLHQIKCHPSKHFSPEEKKKESRTPMHESKHAYSLSNKPSLSKSSTI